MSPKPEGVQEKSHARRQPLQGLGGWVEIVGAGERNPAEVEAALKEQHGLDNKDQGSLLKAVFLHLKRRDTSCRAEAERQAA